MSYFQNVNSFCAFFSNCFKGCIFMTLKDRIKKLCKLNKIPVSKLEADLDFAGGYIAKLDKSAPNVEKISAIANYLNVTIDFLMGKTDLVVCPICGFGDNPLSEQSRKQHEEFHNKFLLAKEKYPFLLNYTDAEKLRSDSIGDFLDLESSINEQIVSFENYSKALFSLELGRYGYEIRRLDYDQFFQSRIGMCETDGTISHELADAIVEKHGLNRKFINNDDLLLARASNNQQLMRLLAYASKLSPKMLDSIEIQLKALAENEKQG